MESVKKVKSKKKVTVFAPRKKTGDLQDASIRDIQSKYTDIDTTQVNKFTDLPLSQNTLRGLKESGYLEPTDIQKDTIGLALVGKDVLGAAQTGSGKTLAFLIPVLETLYCKKWSRLDGVGAIIITPTRELAYQIFKTLRNVGRHHDFSAGLIIGGKDLKFERKRMDQCNIIICTPGRLLQHMDENPLFDCVNMQILVLDEADRCLDMGFEPAMNAIIANLPPKRQTLLFSATQTKSVRDLVRLSLKDPSYISVHENATQTTPKGLHQNYVICELQDKLSIIWSFIKNHKHKKSIVFFSTCKQVKYVYEIFCKLQPGLSIMALYGSLHQLRRMDIYETFCRKQSAILFATDLAARGLDFPEVHWVVQADCPEDSATYIHRVGRTARFHKNGESLLLLLPSETDMVEQLLQRKVPINKIDINPIKLMNPVRKMEAYLAKDPNLKATAQRAFVAYAKSVFLMKDKTVFDVHSLNTDAFAKSFGLAIPPRIRFLQKLNTTVKKPPANTKITFTNDDSDHSDADNKDDDENDDEEIKEKLMKSDDESDSGVSNSELSLYKTELKAETKCIVKKSQKTELKAETKSIGKKNQITTNVQPEKQPRDFQVSDASDSDDDDGILTIKRKDHDIELPSAKEMDELHAKDMKNRKPITKAALAKKILRKKITPNRKTVFDDEGEPIASVTKDKRSELALEYEQENVGGIDLERAKLVLREEDKFDKQLFKEKVKLKHREEKRKLKEQRQQRQDDFGSEEEEDAAPDVSWLPDPDRIYGGEERDEANESNDDLVIEMSQKRKQPQNTKKVSNKKMKIAEVSSSLSLNEAENLAMMLLNNK